MTELTGLDRVIDSQQPALRDVHAVFDKWLHLDRDAGDFDFIDTALAVSLDRDISGDPVWLFLIAPSGGMKTETLRSLDNWNRTYTLDTLTPRALVSGKRTLDEDGNSVLGGILHALDSKVLVMKDFTAILSMPDRDRQEVFGTLRNAYDGYLEKAFGTEHKKVSQKASFGLIAGVTPHIDVYQKFQTTLGERWLKIRQSPDRRETTKRARQNAGRQESMREEIAGTVGEYLGVLVFDNVPTYTEEQEETLESLAGYVALMRAWVYVNTFRGKVYDVNAPEPEVPTRAVQQLTKLGQMLAIVRGHETVTEEDMDTLRRVARDTAIPKRQRILEAMVRLGTDEALYADIKRESGLHYNSAVIECEKMIALDILRARREREEYQDRHGDTQTREKAYLRISEDFKPFCKTTLEDKE